MTRRARVLAACALLALAAPPAGAAATVTVGSKAFPESWILGEALARRARAAGAEGATHRANLGGTEIVDQALRSGAIDAYPEYTGTIAEVILKRTDRPPLDTLAAGLAPLGLAITPPLGFNDGYGIAVTHATAARLGLRTLSDLAAHPELRFGLTHEFLGRADGWPGLAARYGLAPRRIQGLQHELAWDALAHGAIDATDVYTTDAPIVSLDLVVLDDDRGFFPRYDAVVLYRTDLARRAPAVLAAWRALAGRIDTRTMTRANALVALGKRPYEEAADSLLAWAAPGPAGAAAAGGAPAAGPWATLLARLAEHVRLVALSLALAVAIGLPLGVLATRSRLLARLALGAASLVQTVPSLALLAFLIPLVGIGVGPALIALFVYSLLPIVRNTYVGLTTLPPALVEAAEAMGLSPRTRLFRVALPLASPTILAGVQTSAVINVGTATIAALIGAGGLGEPILSGIQLRDPARIAMGAVPAALLALAVSWGFDALERFVVPRGLRRREAP